MKYRIRFLKTFSGVWTSEPVVLADHHELILALSERGAGRCSLAWKGYYDDFWQVFEGPFPVSNVSAEHFEWLKGNSRGLIYYKD
jgi:hypothetical protein